MQAPASIAIIGDSTVDDNKTLYKDYSLPLEFCRLLNISPIGVKGYGFFGLWRNEWSLTTGANAWTKATVSNTWDSGPLLGSTFGTGVYTGNNSNQVATWTKPTHVSVTSFDLHVIDGASSGNFSFRIDGGSWINVSNTWDQNNSYDRITITSVVNTNVEVRCANAAGTGVQTYLVGLEPHDSNSNGQTAVHAMGASSEFSYSWKRTTAGNWAAWLQTQQPRLVFLECPFTNDILFWGDPNIQTNCQSIIDVVKGYGGDVWLFCFGEQNGRNVTHQAEARTMAHNLAASNGLYIVDFYALWGNFAAANAAGYMQDDLHPSVNGNRFMAQRLLNPLFARSGQWGRFRA